MKLKIVQQNPDILVGEQKVMAMMMMKEGNQIDVVKMGILPEEEFGMKNSPPLNPAPISAFPHILVTGKRKRKPIIRRKEEKSSASKFKDGILDGGGTVTRSDQCINYMNSIGEASALGSSSPVQMKSPTMIRAEEVQSSLGNDQPSFLKALVRSHVASCFWMGLPVPFCKLYLPSQDTLFFLENEVGEEFVIKYIAQRTGLSAGWRKFVAENKLLEGDVLIFQLTGTCRFKVLIIRANDLTEVDGALSLLILDSQTKPSDADVIADVLSKRKRHSKPLPLSTVQKKKPKKCPYVPEGHSGNDSDEVASEVLEGCKLSGSSINFKDVKSFKEFSIVVNQICINSELPEHIRRKYYELCCSKNAFLHEHFLPGLCSKLAAGVIFETVHTADAIRASKFTTSRKEFEIWEKCLKSFELLGLNVGFLQARLHRLLSLTSNSEGALNSRKYWDAKTERSRTEDEIQNLEAKLVELKELSAECDHDIKNLQMKAENYELVFEEKANAPW